MGKARRLSRPSGREDLPMPLIAAAIVAVILIAVFPAIATALGVIVVLSSIVVFGWGIVGLAVPHKVGLIGRGHAVGLWIVSIVMFIVGGIILPDEPPQTVAGLEVAAEEEPEIAATDPAVALAETAATQPDPALVPEPVELPAPPPEPTIEQKQAALDRLNAASDRLGAVMSEINRKCAPPASGSSYALGAAYAKCIAGFLVEVCPDIGEGYLNDMSDAARDMDAPVSASLLEQAALDCWNAVYWSDTPNGGRTLPVFVGNSVTQMGEKMAEASARLR